MPDSQLEVSCLLLLRHFVLLILCSFQQVLTTSLGSTYSMHFTSFDRIPFAAASIGQVHHAVLSASSSPTGKEEPVAVKVQFPNIVSSIESDLGYVKMLLTAGSLLPKGLFLDRTIQVGNVFSSSSSKEI